MRLTDQEIKTISEWQPLAAGFGRDNPQTEIRIQQLVAQINALSEYVCEFVEGDGLSNYYVLFAYQRADVPVNVRSREVQGLLLYLSACGPLAVAGYSQKYVAPAISYSARLELASLLTKDHVPNKLTIAIVEALRSAGYELLTAEEVALPLPAGVQPDEYCLCSEPWDRVFHALFANTD